MPKQPIHRCLVREEGMPPSSVEDVVACVEQVRRSDLWKRVEGAEAVLSEVPFSVTREGEDLPRTTTGTVDVAFREADGWVLADYKSDAVDGNLEALVDHYRSQVETYRACWEEITGEAVKEAGLYFVGADAWVVI